MFVRNGTGNSFKGIAFGMSTRVDELKKGSRIRMAYKPKISEYGGYPEVELDLKDLRT